MFEDRLIPSQQIAQIEIVPVTWTALRVEKEFAEYWIQAWNNHDIESIFSHCTEDVEYFSPFLNKAS